MSKKRKVRSPGSDSTSTASAGGDKAASAAGPGNTFAASQMPGRDEKEVAEEKAADALAWKAVSHMRAEGHTDMKSADPRSEFIPPMLAQAMQAVSGVDVSETPMWTTGADRKAEEMGAQAFAVDEEIWMPRSEWKPSDPDFMFLIAHEVAHVALNHVPVGGPTRQHALVAPSIGFVKRGSRGNGVRDLQNALVNLGFMTAAQMATGPGIFGNRTHTAVTAFQAAKGLTVDGIVGPQTQGAIVRALTSAHENEHARTEGDAARSTVALTGRPMMKQGDEGVLVKELQRQLNSFGANLAIDGEFGPATARAVRGFQSANSIKVDGEVGPQTVGVLGNANAQKIAAGGGGAQSGAPMPVGSVDVDVDDADPGGRLRDSRMNPDARRLAVQTVKTLQSQGLSPYIVDGYRSFEKQDRTYEQGRSRPGDIVTYVRGGGSWHNYGLAVDIAFWNNAHTRPVWDAPMSHWRALGNAGKGAGFTRWMGDSGWDYPHLEYHPKWGNRASNLVPTYQQGGLQAVWNRVT